MHLAYHPTWQAHLLFSCLVRTAHSSMQHLCFHITCLIAMGERY